MSMKKMAAGEFKARCLALMEDVSKTREPVLITKRGRPIAKLVPAERSEQGFIGRLEGRVRITGDIESPIELAEAWEVLR
jgi:prevent-host-death family protein